jgi:predicted MPP superfamily phosphohydrolase
MFFIVASLVMLFMAIFSAKQLISRKHYILYGLLLYFMMYLAVFARIAIAKLGHSDLILTLAWVGYVSIGMVSMLFCAAVIKFFVNTGGLAVSKASPKFSPSRRQFLSKSVGSAMSLAVLPLAGYGVYRAVGDPAIKNIKISKENIHPNLKGLRIVQLSDIHVGPTIGEETVRRLVDITNTLDADIVAITGDLVDGSARYISEYVNGLSSIKSKYGTYFVTGNHEYYSGAEAWVKKVQEMGIKVLSNDNITIDHNGAKLLLAGVPDLQSDRFGFEKPMPERAFKSDNPYDISILLAHRPELAEDSAKAGFDIQLSGHTHGGQYFPWTVVIHLFQKYVRGLYKIDDMILYVSQGTAYWGPPLRIGAESEISVIELV